MAQTLPSCYYRITNTRTIGVCSFYLSMPRTWSFRDAAVVVGNRNDKNVRPVVLSAKPPLSAAPHSTVGIAMSHDNSFVSHVPRSPPQLSGRIPPRRSLPLVETTVLSVFIRSPISLVSNSTTFCYVPIPEWIVVYSGPSGFFCYSLNK